MRYRKFAQCSRPGDPGICNDDAAAIAGVPSCILGAYFVKFPYVVLERGVWGFGVCYISTAFLTAPSLNVQWSFSAWPRPLHPNFLDLNFKGLKKRDEGRWGMGNKP